MINDHQRTLLPAQGDTRDIDPSKIMTRKDAVQLLYEIDGVITNIKQQIDEATANVNVSGVYADPKWWAASRAAAKHWRRLRVRMQERLGELARLERANRQMTVERAFMDTAMKVLPVETVRKVWDALYAAHPELREMKS